MEIINDRPEYGSQSRARERPFVKAEKFKKTFFLYPLKRNTRLPTQ